MRSDEQAARAYLGLDGLIETGIDLGFKGISDTNGANIPPEMAAGAKSGVVTATGTVDQGSSSNKNMTLALALAGFSNDGKVTYDAPVSGKPQPALAMRIMKGTSLWGTLSGDVAMAGELEGTVTLALTFDATLDGDVAGGHLRRRRHAVIDRATSPWRPITSASGSWSRPPRAGSTRARSP